MMVSSQSYYFSCIVTLYFFFLVPVVLRTLALRTPHYCRDDQRDALLEFKHEFPISSATDEVFSSWNKSSDCCSWDGVKCDAKSGEVNSLVLFDSVLNSSFKTNTSLFKLQHLQILILYNCSLYGEIPSSLGNLSHLIHLDLSSNKLVGQVPSSLGNLSHLTHLGLSVNDLVGHLPSSLQNLTQLEHLTLGYNNFSGNIPLSFSNSAKLSYLDISSNRFITGNFFSLVPNLTRLSSLYLNSNNFQSKFPADMSRLHNLEYFDASENSFSGPFPKSLFTNPSLLTVNLGRNQFKGPIEFGNIPSSSRLNYLSLADNNFDGLIPKSISKLVELSALDLSNNKFEGQVPGCLRRLGMKLKLSQNVFSSFGKSWETFGDSTIQELMLNSNSFQGPFPHWICNLKSLRILDLSNNLFNGSIPPCLRNSTSYLEVLVLRNNSLTGTLRPDIFVNATSLRVLDVSSNQLVGKLPKSLINCTSMQFLNVGRNKIKDEFPYWLGSLPMLNILLLRSNQFYGPLYDRHVSSRFQDLRVIDVSHNDFTGTLPSFYFSSWLQMTTLGGRDVDPSSIDVMYIDIIYMNPIFWVDHPYYSSIEMVNKGVELEFERIHKDYKAIDFSGNRLWGKIPESIGLLKSLHLLNLSGNTFTCTIPSSLGNFTNLEALDLSQNRLSGHIPRGLGSLSSLSYMNFSYNNLEGPVPRGIQFQSQDCSSFMNNPRLYGLEEICVETHVPNSTPQQSQQSEESPEPEEPTINWIAAGIAYGPGVLCGLVIGHMFASHIHEWSFVKMFGRNKSRVVTTNAR